MKRLIASVVAALAFALAAPAIAGAPYLATFYFGVAHANTWYTETGTYVHKSFEVSIPGGSCLPSDSYFKVALFWPNGTIQSQRNGTPGKCGVETFGGYPNSMIPYTLRAAVMVVRPYPFYDTGVLASTWRTGSGGGCGGGHECQRAGR